MFPIVKSQLFLMETEIQKYDEVVHSRLYKKYVGVKTSEQKKQGCHKNEDLVRKIETSTREKNRKRRRKRKSSHDVDDVIIIDDMVFENNKNIINEQLHIEQIKALPSEETPLQKPSLFWRILGY